MLRFTIRDVLLLMLAAGLAAGWVADRRALASKLSKTQRDLREACFQLGMKASPFD